MAFYLLSFHGALVGFTGQRLHPLCPTAGTNRTTTPVALDAQHNALAPGGAFVRAQPITTVAQRPLVALRAGNAYLSSRSPTQFDAVPLCATWEHFLLITPELAELLRTLLRGTWHDGRTFVGQPTCTGHELRLGPHTWPVEQLQAELRADTLTLWSTTAPQKVTLTACPSRVLENLLENVTELLDVGAFRRALSPWATVEDVREQVLKLSITPSAIAPCIGLAQLCCQCGQGELGMQFAVYAQSFAQMADLVWLQALIALRLHDHARAADLLAVALRERYPKQDFSATLPALLTRLRQGEDALLLVPDMLYEHDLPGFDERFDTLLVPMRLAARNGPDIRQIYAMLFENAYQRLNTATDLRLLETEARLNGLSWWTETAMGHTSWLAGLMAEADAHYAIARRLALQEGAMPSPDNAGIFSWLSAQECNKMASRAIPDRTGVSRWEWRFSPAGTPPALCLVFACDSANFHLLPGLILSLLQAYRQDRSSGPVQLCIGVANPNTEQLAFLRTIADWLEQYATSLRLSFGHGPTAERDTALEPALRYLVLPDIVARFRCPVMTGDCAGYFPANTATLLRTLKNTATYGFDLALFNHDGRQSHGTPWGIGTDTAYFGEPERLPAIAAFMNDYLNTVYTPKSTVHTAMDRCALAQMLRHFILPRWSSLSVRFMNEGAPVLVMPAGSIAAGAMLASQADVLHDLAVHTPRRTTKPNPPTA
ncbi:hypothetical protein [Acetobacter sp. LMG 32666]|uniref:hypothetical protein n=1 Tax=Acetobacter sp. LMG 32666 TaxID=2959295 RepID=UPI0030C8645D